LVSAVLVMALLIPNRLTTALAWRPLAVIGVASYSIYLVHWPVILILTEDRVGVDGWALVAIKVLAAGIVAVALHLAVEQPIRRAIVANRRVAIAWASATLAVTVLAVAVL
jgi:peptidoglycan/LPS O-acetylase OafA/YrhL